jgi:exosome complex RNA-binding protein Csl4
MEWSCVCNECDEKWHYLDSVEQKITNQMSSNSMDSHCCVCHPCRSSLKNKNTQLLQQKMKLRSCPKCGSSNITKIAKYFKK